MRRTNANPSTSSSTPKTTANTTTTQVYELRHRVPSSTRPVLAALPSNHRRLPSRQHLKDGASMLDKFSVPHIVGKRKRIESANENAHNGGRPTRGAGRMKRLRSTSGQSRGSTDTDSTDGAMDVEDTQHRFRLSDDSDEDEEDEEDGVEHSSEDYLINSAQPSRLQKLRKDELVRLYVATGLTEDAEALTKAEIVQAIVDSRDDVASLPPSSPPRGDDLSDYSSDDPEDVLPSLGRSRSAASASKQNGLKRRATYNITPQTNFRVANGRTYSMGNLICNGATSSGPASAESSKRRSRTNSRPSPPATRLRTRQTSTSSIASPTSGGSAGSKGKGKARHQPATPIDKPPEPAVIAEDSDLTDLDELENNLKTPTAVPLLAKEPPQPSPRRLRSQDKLKATSSEKPNGRVKSKGSPAATSSRHSNGSDAHSESSERRVVPMRKAKKRIGTMKEDTTEEEASSDSSLTEVEELEDDQLQDEEDEEEVDELASAPTPTMKRTRTVSTTRCLRRRQQDSHQSACDADDEGEEPGDEDEDAEEGVEPMDADDDDDDDEEDEEEAKTLVGQPRKLRNGKIVGESEMDVDEERAPIDDEEDDDTEDSAEDASADEESVDLGGEEEDSLDADAEEDGEADESDEFDLTVATKAHLRRLRRDNLIRLCEQRNLQVSGTKAQLTDALLEWRDSQGSGFSSPSSTGTARPPSTIRHPRRRRTSSSNTASGQKTPVLERSHRVHLDEPRTPPINQPEPELELDLESLGLEDREIPFDKLTKLEKIGSGGFKDVFVGKLKGRKIAISEFRGQLSPMDIKELKLLGGFNHPNIVRFLGVSVPENTKEVPVMIVSELCSNGDLFDYVRNIEVAPSLYRVLCMMLDIARGLDYLHSCKPSVIHRDCKSSNILITSKGIAKIADFGLAKVKQSTRSMVRSLVGTVNWQAPELWHAHPKYNHKVDVFSCAMVYWEMMQWAVPSSQRKFPWEGMNEHAIYDIVGQKRQRPSISGLRNRWCPGIVDLVERMWAHEHADRPTMPEVVEELESLVQAARTR